MISILNSKEIMAQLKGGLFTNMQSNRLTSIFYMFFGIFFIVFSILIRDVSSLKFQELTGDR